MEFVAPLEHGAMFRNQSKRPLLQMKPGAFLDPHLGPFRVAAVGRENRHVGIDPQRIIAPMTGSDHSSIEIEDPRKLRTVETGKRAPVPGLGERRDDAQARLALGWG